MCLTYFYRSGSKTRMFKSKSTGKVIKWVEKGAQTHCCQQLCNTHYNNVCGQCTPSRERVRSYAHWCRFTLSSRLIYLLLLERLLVDWNAAASTIWWCLDKGQHLHLSTLYNIRYYLSLSFLYNDPVERFTKHDLIFRGKGVFITIFLLKKQYDFYLFNRISCDLWKCVANIS